MGSRPAGLDKVGSCGITLKDDRRLTSERGPDATRDQVKQLLAMVVKEVTTKDRVVDEIRLRLEAMPFFASPDPVLVLAPPDGRRGSEAKALDPLAWYASA